MPYMGKVDVKASDIKRFSVTGSTSATHTLSWTAPSEQALIITINGVKQQDGAYTIAGTPTTITLSSALVATDEMEVIGINDIGQTNTVAQDSIVTDMIRDDAVTSAKLDTNIAIDGDLTVDTDTLYVDSTNNRVGIGTTSPSTQLGFPIGNNIKISQVAGSAHAAGNVGSVGLTIADGGNHSGVFVNNTHNGTYSSQDITFLTAQGGISTATERMRIDSSGRVTMPYQPSFHAYFVSNWSGWIPSSQTQVIPYSGTYHDTGNNFNTSTGLFTAPVAGNYFFTAGAYTSTHNAVQLWFVKNGTRMQTFMTPLTTAQSITHCAGMLKLAANDTVGVHPYNSPSTAGTILSSLGHTYFLGFFAG